MKKWKIENSEKSEISKISEKLFRVFLFLSFRFCSTAKIYIENSEKLEISEISEKLFRVFDFALQPNSDLKISEKISEISEVSQFLTWSSTSKICQTL